MLGRLRQQQIGQGPGVQNPPPGGRLSGGRHSSSPITCGKHQGWEGPGSSPQQGVAVWGLAARTRWRSPHPY